MKKVLFLICMLVLVGTSISAKKSKFPKVDEYSNYKAGDIIIKAGYFKNEYFKQYDKKIDAEYASLIVPENRTKENSRLIDIPVLKIKSKSQNPLEPVFLLYGGPGSSNIINWRRAMMYLHEDHDIVMVGYRGIDGSVLLNSDLIPEAIDAESYPLSSENLKEIGEACYKEHLRYKSEGIDIDGYNVIEVIDDIETARIALGYDKINLFGSSFGTRIAYLMGVKYPESVNRTCMELVNTPGTCVWEPENNDAIFNYLNEEWKSDTNCVKRSPDIVKTIKNVLATLPVRYKKETLDPDKVKMMMFGFMYTQDGIRMLFDAFIAAENGDYSGIAFLSIMFDLLPEDDMVWGEMIVKAVSADYDYNRDYEIEMEPEGSVIGSPMSKLFGLMKYKEWPMKQIPDEYKKLQKSEVQTLMINGTIDISTPIVQARELLTYLPNGHLVELENRGHQDLGYYQKAEFEQLIIDFYKTGAINDSGFNDMQLDFSPPETTLMKLGKIFYRIKRLRLLKLAGKLM